MGRDRRAASEQQHLRGHLGGCGERFCYRVRAYRESDRLYSACSHLAAPQTPACTLPATPTGLTATTISQSRIDLTWTDKATDETPYSLHRSSDGVTGWTEIAVLPAGSSSYQNSNLNCGTPYRYRVRAYRETDETYSPYSNGATATTDLCPLPAPTTLSVTAVSSSQIDLAWTDNAADETAYHVERSLKGTSDWMEITVLPRNSTSYSDTHLACGTEYHFRVRAYWESDAQYSPYCSTANAETKACPSAVFLPLVLRTVLWLTFNRTGAVCHERVYLRRTTRVEGRHHRLRDSSHPEHSSTWCQRTEPCGSLYSGRL